MGPTSKKNDEKQKGIRKDQNGIRREIERIFLNFFFIFASFSDSRKPVRQNSSG